MSQRIRAFIVGCLGGAVGSFVALDVRPTLWWLGLIVGGLIGYIGYDPKTAWQTFRYLLRKQLYKTAGAITAIIFLMVCGLVVGVAYMAAVVIGMFGSMALALPTDSTSSPVVSIVLLVIAILGIAWGAYEGKNRIDPNRSLATRTVDAFDAPFKLLGSLIESKPQNRPELWRVLVFNPITALFLVGPLMMIFIVGMVTQICVWIIRGLAVAPAVAMETLILIHCDARVILALASTLGVLAGYFSGSAIIGGLAGGVLGCCDLAFVRQRVLAVAKRRKL